MLQTDHIQVPASPPACPQTLRPNSSRSESATSLKCHCLSSSVHDLQGGPGCSSLFGMLYINGPYFINEEDLTLKANPGSWNRLYGMLFIEQPIGTGYSVRGVCDLDWHAVSWSPSVTVWCTSGHSVPLVQPQTHTQVHPSMCTSCQALWRCSVIACFATNSDRVQVC